MTYWEQCAEKAAQLREKKHARILAIETSCDETAAAVVEDGRLILSSIIASQVDVHALYGGVVPEIASRRHVEAVDHVVDEALAVSGHTMDGIDAVAVTYGPGLVGALLVGVSYAKALAYGSGLPLIPVNHMEGHIAAAYLAEPNHMPPFICLIASGGHSQIVEVRGYTDFHVLGETLDDAAGEAFDKAARVLGLPYPGGPLLDALAEKGDARALALPKPKLAGKYDFSFSGLKTALMNRVRTCEGISLEDIAASFRRAVVEELVDKSLRAAKERGAGSIAVVGGVAANSLLRRLLLAGAQAAQIGCVIPPIALCTDNAAMIASAAYFRLMAGALGDLRLNAKPNAALGEPLS